MKSTKVKELMTAHPTLISPDATLQDAAKQMKKIDCGVLPVGTADKLEGVITDRDITIRAVAEGRDPTQAKVSQYMSDRVYTCNEENSLKEAANIMAKHKISRLVVDNEDGKITGILTFGCVLRKGVDAAEISEVVANATRKQAA